MRIHHPSVAVINLLAVAAASEIIASQGARPSAIRAAEKALDLLPRALTPAERDRIIAAQAKRDRKAARRATTP
jgi:hypothetical protein